MTPAPVIPDFGKGSECVTGDHLFCWDWVREHWGDTLEPKLIDHIELTLIAVAIGFVLAFGLALLAHRAQALDHPIGIAAALIYTIPSLAIFQILIPFFGLSTTTIEIPLVGYSLVILYPNIIAGLACGASGGARGGPRDGPRRVARCSGACELPLALPAIIGGLRIASRLDRVDRHDRRLPRRARPRRADLHALKLPTPFKTEIYAAGLLVVVLAPACDLLLVLLRRVLVPWTRVGRA